jgi:hypothetical protein
LNALENVKFKSSEIGKYVDKVKKLVDSSKDFNTETEKMLENQDARNDDIKSEYGAIKTLADKYFDLADGSKLSADKHKLLKTYADELIKKIPELSKYIDDQTGAYKGTKEEIQKCIDKTEEYYLLQAAQDDLVEIAKKQYDATLIRTQQTVVDTVTKAYLELLRAQGLADVANQRVVYIEGQQKMIKARVEAGDAAEVDVFPIDAQLANAHVDQLTAKNTVRTSAIQLQK